MVNWDRNYKKTISFTIVENAAKILRLGVTQLSVAAVVSLTFYWFA